VNRHPSGNAPSPVRWYLLGLLLGLSVIALVSPLLLQTALSDPRGDPKLGKGIYDKRCASCHGQKGDGLGFKSALPNFSDAGEMAKKTDQELFNKITNGGKGTGMPAWKKVLSDAERWDVLAYIRTLARP